MLDAAARGAIQMDQPPVHSNLSNCGSSKVLHQDEHKLLLGSLGHAPGQTGQRSLRAQSLTKTREPRQTHSNVFADIHRKPPRTNKYQANKENRTELKAAESPTRAKP